LFDSRHDVQAIDSIAPRVSAGVEGGTNVEFVSAAAPQRFGVVVWERGVGRTLACGTGAVATAAAAIAEGRAKHDDPITIDLPGGALQVVVSADYTARLVGPAVRVFRGELAE
jgi:diaminopimelate epimerase